MLQMKWWWLRHAAAFLIHSRHRVKAQQSLCLILHFYLRQGGYTQFDSFCFAVCDQGRVRLSFLSCLVLSNWQTSSWSITPMAGGGALRHATGTSLSSWFLKAAGLSCSTTAAESWFQSPTVLAANELQSPDEDAPNALNVNRWFALVLLSAATKPLSDDLGVRVKVRLGQPYAWHRCVYAYGRPYA